MHCGKPLRAALAILPATPDPDLCPLCHQKGALVKTLFQESPPDLAKELAPPQKPLWVRTLSREGVPKADGLLRPTAQGKITVRSFVASVYTAIVWTLGGLAIVLLLLAARKLGSYQDLLSAVLHSSSVGAIISTGVAASMPLLLGAFGTLAAVFGLVTIKAVVDQLWQARVIAYERAIKNWQTAHYCPTDRIVFIRNVTAVRWDPVEELHHLIAQDGTLHLG
jgi:hypothetical protein